MLNHWFSNLEVLGLSLMRHLSPLGSNSTTWGLKGRQNVKREPNLTLGIEGRTEVKKIWHITVVVDLNKLVKIPSWKPCSLRPGLHLISQTLVMPTYVSVICLTIVIIVSASDFRIFGTEYNFWHITVYVSIHWLWDGPGGFYFFWLIFY